MTELSTMEQFWVWLSSIDGIGPVRFYALLSEYGDARTVWDEASKKHKIRSLGEKTQANVYRCCTQEYFEQLFTAFRKREITPLTRISDLYSPLLNQTDDAPPTLYVRGDPDLVLTRPFAIVGTRRPTRDGYRAAQEFSERLALSGATIVSGLARGIDTQAHTACLNAGGKTVAVLGCGCDVVYPPENRDLYDRILENDGAIISEYSPGTGPLSQNFPARNRIISGLSRGTLLVEGSLHSGGLITTGYALDQGRDVFAVPGSIYSDAAKGPNMLISQGATPVFDPWDIPENYHWAQRPGKSPVKSAPAVALSPEEEQIVAPLRSEEMTQGELQAATGLPIARLSTLLTMLELRGIVGKVPGGGYRATK